MASSAWNCSKGFPGGGITITLGPVGIVAHPLIMRPTIVKRIIRLLFIISLLLLVRWTRRRNNLQPAAGTFFYVRIVIPAIRAEIPVILLILLRGSLDIFLRLLLDDRRFRIVWIVWIIVWIVWVTPPPRTPSAPPSRTDPDTSTPVTTTAKMSTTAKVTITPKVTTAAKVSTTAAAMFSRPVYISGRANCEDKD
jgi:hypothetical protein